MERKASAKNSAGAKLSIVPLQRACSRGCILITIICLACCLNVVILNVWSPIGAPVDSRSLLLTRQSQRKVPGITVITAGPQVVSDSRRLVARTRKLAVRKNSTSSNHRNDSVLELLHRAGILDELDNRTIEQLPKADTIKLLYGSKAPYIHGMETCETFRRQVPPEEAYLGVAGMFNTGTNALAYLLHLNIMMNHGVSWQVPWGKHRLASGRLNHTANRFGKLDKKAALPIVVIKDPLMWMQSMCRSPYAVRWTRDPTTHCPNLIPTAMDRKRFRRRLTNTTVVPVSIKFDNETVFWWNSLVDLWNDWYRQYLDADYPRLIIRFEDLLFHPEAVTTQIAQCAGARLRQPLVYKVESSKKHGSKTNLIGALIKSGSRSRRTLGMTRDDLKYAHQHLDAELMSIFHYRYPTSMRFQKG